MNNLYEKVNAKLKTDEIGYREWIVQDRNGNFAVVGLRKTENGSWKWSMYETSGTPKDSFMPELKEFADSVAQEFSKKDAFGNSSI